MKSMLFINAQPKIVTYITIFHDLNTYFIDAINIQNFNYYTFR